MPAGKLQVFADVEADFTEGPAIDGPWVDPRFVPGCCVVEEDEDLSMTLTACRSTVFAGEPIVATTNLEILGPAEGLTLQEPVLYATSPRIPYEGSVQLELSSNGADFDWRALPLMKGFVVPREPRSSSHHPVGSRFENTVVVTSTARYSNSGHTLHSNVLEITVLDGAATATDALCGTAFSLLENRRLNSGFVPMPAVFRDLEAAIASSPPSELECWSRFLLGVARVRMARRYGKRAPAAQHRSAAADAFDGIGESETQHFPLRARLLLHRGLLAELQGDCPTALSLAAAVQADPWATVEDQAAAADLVERCN